jgi:hypothetical protein
MISFPLLIKKERITMGGTVAITLRTPDKKVYKMSRWTNIMPHFINNARLFLKQQGHIDDFLYQYNLMKEDWEKNKSSGNFDFNFPSSGLAPEGYGLVVVDMVNDVILSSQGYCSFERLHLFEVQNLIQRFLHNDQNKTTEEAINYFLNRKEDPEEGPNVIQVIKELYYNNFITSVSEWSLRGKIKHHSLDEFKDFNSFIKYALKGKILEKELNIKGFNVENFEEYDKEDGIKMRDRIIELGFVLDEKDLKQWDDFLKEIDEEE